MSVPVAKGQAAKNLIGAWRYAGTRINGANWDRGSNPKGMIYYGPHGEMAVQIAPDVERKRAGEVMTPDEAFVAVKDYIAYFGTYTVDEDAGNVRHHRDDNLKPGESGDSCADRARNLVERFFKIKHCRRVATRYDKLAANYLAFVNSRRSGYGCALMTLRPSDSSRQAIGDDISFCVETTYLHSYLRGLCRIIRS